MQSLTHFLAQERAIAELRQAKILARQGLPHHPRGYRAAHSPAEPRYR